MNEHTETPTDYGKLMLATEALVHRMIYHDGTDELPDSEHLRDLPGMTQDRAQRTFLLHSLQAEVEQRLCGEFTLHLADVFLFDIDDIDEYDIFLVMLPVRYCQPTPWISVEAYDPELMVLFQLSARNHTLRRIARHR